MAYVFPIPGWRGTVQLHHGTDKGASDLFADRGTPVVSMTEGRVTSAGNDGLGGNNVMITGNDGLTYYYAHFNTTPSVRTGDRVSAGNRIGVVGDSGNAAGTGPHLHLGIGYGIASGSGARGGSGNNFDAVGFLRTILAGGNPPPPSGSPSVGEGVSGYIPDPGAIAGDVTGGAITALAQKILDGFSNLLGRGVTPRSADGTVVPVGQYNPDKELSPNDGPMPDPGKDFPGKDYQTTGNPPPGFNVWQNYNTPLDNPFWNFTNDKYYKPQYGEIDRWPVARGRESNRARVWRWIFETYPHDPGSVPMMDIWAEFQSRVLQLKRDYGVMHQQFPNDPQWDWSKSGYDGFDPYL